MENFTICFKKVRDYFDENSYYEWEGLEEYLSEKLLISHTGKIRVKEGLVSVEAEIPLLLAIRFPFVKEILTGQEGKRIYLSHEKLNAPYIVWDSEVIKGRK